MPFPAVARHSRPRSARLRRCHARSPLRAPSHRWQYRADDRRRERFSDDRLLASCHSNLSFPILTPMANTPTPALPQRGREIDEAVIGVAISPIAQLILLVGILVVRTIIDAPLG